MASQVNPLTERKYQQIYHLLIVEDKQGKRTIALDAATYSIGRDPNNAIILNSKLVSRQHAILLRVTIPDTANYLFRLIDGNLQGKRSTNGLTINGKRCFAHDLKHGDVITFGGDVTAGYYACSDLADVKLLTACNVEELPGFLSDLNNPFDTIISEDIDLDTSREAAIVRLASFPELISNPILEINLTGAVTYLNPAAIAQFPNIQAGVLRETSRPHPILADLISTVQQSRQKYLVREVELNHQVFEQSIHYIAESDLIRTYIVNITERKQAEAALRNSQQKLLLHVQQTPLAVVEWSPDFEIIDWNPAAEVIFGYSKDEVLGHHATETILPENVRGHINQVRDELVAKKGGTYSINENLTKDGRTILCEWYNTPLVNNNGNVIAVASLGQDITERQQAQQSLQQAHDQLGNRVEERTAELKRINEQLRHEIAVAKHLEQKRRQAEEEVRFLQAMTQAISEAQDFHSALEVVLRQVCEATGWSYGEAWIPNPDTGTLLQCSPAWYNADSCQNYPQERAPVDINLISQEASLKKFRRISETLTFPPDSGLPGRVWLSGQPEWIQDVSGSPATQFLRAQIARGVGFKAGLGIPIISNVPETKSSKTLAVLVFFMFASHQEDKHLVELISMAATQLGPLIQRKQAEENLRESEERFRLLVEGVKDYAIFILDPDGRVASWNVGAERTKGYRAEEIIGQHFSCFYPEIDIEGGKPEHELEVARAVGQVEDEGWRVRKDGSQFWANAVVTAIRDKTGNLRGFAKLTRDITERKQAEEDIRKALEKEKELGKLKSQFISTASHEFRTPLAIILSSTELLQHYSHKWSEEKKLLHFQRIQTAIKQTTGLLDDVLLIGKTEAGSLKFKPRPLDLARYCRDLIEELQSTTATHRINFGNQAHCSDAVMDAKLLRHILTNLLSNAIKYSPQGKIVYFDLICNQAEAIFQVRDEGIGIPEADQAKLFDLFHRAKNVGTISGTGLGLAIVKRSVDIHGGTISLESRVGAGTTFTVTLPSNKKV